MRFDMKLRCRAGDLAIITKEEPGCEANIGRVVRVSGPIVVREHVGATWLICPVGAVYWEAIYICATRGAVVRAGHSLEQLSNIEHPDRWMVPLRKPRASGKNEQSRVTPGRQPGLPHLVTTHAAVNDFAVVVA
jgi:hypothetical protein